MPQILNFASYVLSEATDDLVGEVRETLPNAGPAVAAYAAPFGLRPPLNWCALAVSTWIRRAAQKAGIHPPVVGSPAAQGLMGQLLHSNLWTPAAVARDAGLAELIFCPGNVIVWRRGPVGSWYGHIGIVEYQENSANLITIEGNSGPKGDRVARMKRPLSDPNWLGIGRFDTVETPTGPKLQEPSCKRDPLTTGES